MTTGHMLISLVFLQCPVENVEYSNYMVRYKITVVERFKYSVVDLPCCVIVASEDYYTFFVARVPRR